MSLFHVVIAGLDRRSLTALGARHRIVVVGHSEHARTGKVTVDAYVAEPQETWLRKHGMPSPGSKRSGLRPGNVRPKVAAVLQDGWRKAAMAT